MLIEKSKNKLAVSRCLIGDNVRYDGRTKPHDFVIQHLARVFDLKPVCPEVEIGMSVPRKPIQLVFKDDTVRALQIDDSSIDYTDSLSEYAEQVNEKISSVYGYVLKARSPSCGVNTTEVINLNEKKSGLFADAIIKQHPFLPIIDESILDDRHYRDQFIENVFCYAAFQANTGEFIREYGLRWVLRTGNNISVLENASLDKLEELFFKPMNQFITVLEKANNLSGALKNNPQIFSFPESRVEDLITEYANDQVSFVCLAQSIGDLLSINNVSGYSLLFSDDELDLRMQ